MLDELDKKIEALSKLYAEITEELGPINANLEQLSMGQVIGYVLLLRGMKEQAGAIETLANISLPNACDRGTKCMDAEGMSTGDFEYNGRVFRVQPDIKLKVSCNKENKPNLIAWMKLHERGKELIKEDIHPATLQAFVEKEIGEYGQERPPFISAFLEPSLAIRKLPAKKG